MITNYFVKPRFWFTVVGIVIAIVTANGIIHWLGW